MFKKLTIKEQLRLERQNGLLQFCKQEEDVNDVAEMTVLNAMDKDDLAEMVIYCLSKIEELEVLVNDKSMGL